MTVALLVPAVLLVILVLLALLVLLILLVLLVLLVLVLLVLPVLLVLLILLPLLPPVLLVLSRSSYELPSGIHNHKIKSRGPAEFTREGPALTALKDFQRFSMINTQRGSIV